MRPTAAIVAAIERDDFRAADVKKLVNLRHGKFYRAKLSDSNRLIFALVRHGGEVCAVMLEIIEQHAYEQSRFLRGAAIDEEKIPALPLPPGAGGSGAGKVPASDEARDPGSRQVPVSRRCAAGDLRSVPPLVVIGGAGSGKTALTLEKMKRVDGDVLYVTHSAYLAQNARDLYYAHGYERDGQDATFLSYREFIESLRVPAGPRGLVARLFRLVRSAAAELQGHRCAIRRSKRCAASSRRRPAAP